MSRLTLRELVLRKQRAQAVQAKVQADIRERLAKRQAAQPTPPKQRP